MGETAQNKSLVREFIEEVFNLGHVDVVSTYVSEDFVNHVGPPGNPSGRESVEHGYQMFTAGFPDWHTVIEDVIAEDDKVVFRGMASGTHQGEFMGMAPTGRRVELPGVHIMRIAGGKIVEHWAFSDSGSLMRQLGATGS